MRLLILALLLGACSKESETTTPEESTPIGGECVYETFTADIVAADKKKENGKFFNVLDEDGNKVYRYGLRFDDLSDECVKSIERSGRISLEAEKTIKRSSCKPVIIDESQLLKAFGCENKQAAASGAIKALQSFDDSYIQEGLESELYYY